MTREEAIEIFEHNWTCLKNYAYTDNELDEALEMAIKALEQTELKSSYNSIKTELNEDAISRQEAIDAMSNALERVFPEHRAIAERTMNKLPSVSTEKTGRWIAQDIHNCHTDFKCSECGYIHNFMHLYGEPTADYTYCPNCGAKMEVEK